MSKDEPVLVNTAYDFSDQTGSGKQKWEDVAGLSFKNNGQVIHNSARPLIAQLDDLPFPARHCLYDVENYAPQALAKLFASRGCPYQCNYCGTQNNSTRPTNLGIFSGWGYCGFAQV